MALLVLGFFHAVLIVSTLASRFQDHAESNTISASVCCSQANRASFDLSLLAAGSTQHVLYAYLQVGDLISTFRYPSLNNETSTDMQRRQRIPI